MTAFEVLFLVLLALLAIGVGIAVVAKVAELMRRDL